MGEINNDTRKEMEILQIQLLSQASPAQKLAMMADLNTTARQLALCGLHIRNPELSEEQLQLRLASLLLGESLAYKVYGEQHPVT